MNRSPLSPIRSNAGSTPDEATFTGPLPALTPGTACHTLMLHLYDFHLGHTNWGYFTLRAERTFRHLEHLGYVTPERPHVRAQFTPHGLALAREAYAQFVTGPDETGNRPA